MIREATRNEVPAMVVLSARKRREYAAYSPRMWHPASDADERQHAFFLDQLNNPTCLALVHEMDERINGFIIARLVGAPPVYNPGGKVCMIDDFVVADNELWATVGIALRNEAQRRAVERGAVLSITVCGQRDLPKRAALLEADAHVASQSLT